MGDEQELITVFEKTLSTNQADIEHAQKYVEQLKQHNFCQFLYKCTKILANTQAPQISRIQAGLQAKNCLTSKDDVTKAQLLQKWTTEVPSNIKLEMKQLIITTLGTEQKRPSSAPQLVAAIANLELPVNAWPELLPWLSESVTSTDEQKHSQQQKEASLEAIGYICADVPDEFVKDYTSLVLTAIVHGMKSGESIHIKLAATNAMLNSLEFIGVNFEISNERDYIMQVVCESTINADTRVKVASLQCLVKIVSLYYIHMESYMGRALFAITVDAMRNSDDGVCLQGIEFWSNVCDEEYELAYEAQEAWDKGQPPARNSQHYAKGALEHLCPILCETLARQDEADCDDDWNPSKAAGVCLMLLSQVTEDDVLAKILPFVETNISHAQWKYRDAAVVALGSILDGPTPSKLENVLFSAMETLIKLFDDESIAVRDSTAWCTGKICEMVPNLALGPVFNQLLEALVKSLTAPPRVAANVCWTITHLVEAVYQAAEIDDENDTVLTYQLSPYFEHIIEKLLLTTNRSDGNECNLRAAAYESIMEMIKNSPDDKYNCVITTTKEIMQRIHTLLQMTESTMSATDRSQYADLQSLLCATLQSVLRKIKPDDISGLANQIMQSLLTMLQCTQSKPVQVDNDEVNYGGVHEDALLAVGTLTEVVKGNFSIYMDAFKPFLKAALQSYEEPAVCSAAVGVVGDISRALGANFRNYVDELMELLLLALRDTKLDQSVRPHILSLFGDICMAINDDFVKYLPHVMHSLTQASSIEIDRNDYDQLDYLNELYEAVITSTTGIVHGLNSSGKGTVSVLVTHLHFICSLVKKIAVDAEKSQSVVSHTCGLLGDLINSLVTESKKPGEPTQIATIAQGLYQYFNDDGIKEMLAEARQSRVVKIKQVAIWAGRELRKLKQIVEPTNTNFANNSTLGTNNPTSVQS